MFQVSIELSLTLYTTTNGQKRRSHTCVQTTHARTYLKGTYFGSPMQSWAQWKAVEKQLSFAPYLKEVYKC